MHSDRMLNRNARCQERSRNGAQKSEAGRTPKRGGVITRGKRNVKGPELSEVQTQNKPRTRPPDTPIERQLRSSTFFFLSNDKVGFVAWKSQLDKGYLLQSRSLWIACPIGSEECSSSESGWTTYIASSPDLEHGQVDNEDDDEYGNIGHQVFKKAAEEEAADSDDSMASDASSGPSGQRHSYGHLGRSLGFVHAGNQDKKKHASKKQSQQEEKKKQRNGEMDNSRNKGNSAGKLKKI